jgi:hypothetical protein
MTGPRWSALAAAIAGEVDLRGSPERARRARTFNARFDHSEPEAIVRCDRCVLRPVVVRTAPSASPSAP